MTTFSERRRRRALRAIARASDALNDRDFVNAEHEIRHALATVEALRTFITPEDFVAPEVVEGTEPDPQDPPPRPPRAGGAVLASGGIIPSSPIPLLYDGPLSQAPEGFCLALPTMGAGGGTFVDDALASALRADALDTRRRILDS